MDEATDDAIDPSDFCVNPECGHPITSHDFSGCIVCYCDWWPAKEMP
jgi:hypothetical protein